MAAPPDVQRPRFLAETSRSGFSSDEHIVGSMTGKAAEARPLGKRPFGRSSAVGAGSALLPERGEQSAELADDVAAQPHLGDSVERRRPLREDRDGATGLARQQRQRCDRMDLE
jgi:hypothetical protein